MSVFGVKFHFKWDGINWVDETDYVLRHFIKIGFNTAPDNLLFDPVAQVGRAWFELDNSSGRFTVGNTSSPIFDYLDAGVEVKVVSISPRMFVGFVTFIDNSANSLTDQKAVIHCKDRMGHLEQVKAVVVGELDKPVSEGIEDLVQLALPSESIDADNIAINDVVPVWGNRFHPQMEILSAIKLISQTYFGWFYCRESFHYKNRREWASIPEKMARETLYNERAPNNQLTRHIKVGLNSAHVRNQIQVIYYPADELGSVVVLWESSTWLGMKTGVTRKYFLKYRDPDTGDDVASLDVEDFTAVTDYLINRQANGSGIDETANPNITISFEIFIQRMVVTVTNNAGYDIFFTKFQCRGKPIIIYDPLMLEYNHTASQAEYGLKSEIIEMATGLPEGDDFDKGAVDLGQLWLEYLAYPYLYASEISIWYTHKYTEDIFDVVDVTWSAAGIDDLHRIMAIEYGRDVHPVSKDLMEYTTFYLIPAVFAPIMISSHTVYGISGENRSGK